MEQTFDLIISTKRTVTEIQSLYRILLNLECVLEGTYLPKAEVDLLCDYAAKGVSKAVDKAFVERTGMSNQSCANLKSSLIKKGMIKKVDGVLILPEMLQNKLEKGLKIEIELTI